MLKISMSRVIPLISLTAIACSHIEAGAGSGEELATLEAGAGSGEELATLEAGAGSGEELATLEAEMGVQRPVCPGAAPGPALYFYRDADGDGFGVDDQVSCDPAPGYVEARGDCDDNDGDVHPGAADPPGDGEDQDCGGTTDRDPHVGLSAGSLTSLQEALDAARPGVTVWVGPGTYREHDLRFRGKAVRLAGTHRAGAAVLDAENLGAGIVLDAGESIRTVIDGLTISHGRAERGAGIDVVDSGATLRDCIVTSNTARAPKGGGGVSVERGVLLVDRCSLTSNRASGDAWGGAIRTVQASAVVRSTTISSNRAENGGGLYLDGSSVLFETVILNDNMTLSYGAGLFASSSNVLMSGSVVRSNRGVYATGGGMYLRGSRVALTRSSLTENGAFLGGAMFADESTVVLTDVDVSRNRAGFDIGGDGGGLLLSRSTGAFTRCTFTANRLTTEGGNKGAAIALDRSSPVLTQCLIADNVVRGYGAGMWISDSSPVLLNSVIVRNKESGPPWNPPGTATPSGAGVHIVGAESRPRILNTIIAYNFGGQTYNLFKDPSASSAEIFYSDLYNPPGEPNHNLPALPRTNLDVEPGFLTYGAGGLPTDLHLALGSPLVDAGLPFLRDVDGSRSDLGLYGGPLGATWDRDMDGYPDYFWPGTISDAPPGVNPADYDANDTDPTTR